MAIALDAEGNPPKFIQLFPMGRVAGRDGRGPWELKDAAHAQAVVEATRAYHAPQDMMGDFDHQLPFNTGPDKGGRAEASAWVDTTTLEVREDGIWASVSWTAEGEAKLRGRGYRYLSPFFGSDKATGLLTRIFNFGLVNQPNIREIAAVASVSLNPGNPPSMKTVLTALGLKEDATEADACAAITTLKTAGQAGEQLAATATALGLATTATGEEVVAAATRAASATPDPSKFVPVETFQNVTGQLKVINEERATAAVDAAIEGGKIVPANRDWALGYFAQDEVGFAAFVQAQAPVLTPGKKPGGKPPEQKDDLTDEERQACAALGVDPAEFLKTRQGEVK